MLSRRRIAFSHVVYTSGFFFLTVALAAIAIVTITLRLAERPQVLKVAVGPPDGIDAKLVEAVARHLENKGGTIRVSVIPVADAAQAAAALEQGRVDLAVIRSDVAIPPNGATVVILHNDLAVIAAPAGSKIRTVPDLAGKRVAIVPPTAANTSLLDAILREYEIAPESVQHVALPADGASPMWPKLADAMLVVGPLKGGSLVPTLAALASGRRAAVLVPVDAAEGIAARGPAYQKADIPAGFLSGSEPQPKEEVPTVSVSTRLEARRNLAEDVVTELAEALFAMRRSLEREVPMAVAIEKPNTDKGSDDAVHPGASAYYDNNEKSFMDRYGDWLYIGAMSLSGLGSMIAGMFALTRARARKAALALIDQLIEVKQIAHTTMELSRLGELEAQIEDLSTKGLHFARDNNFDEAGLAALRLAIDEARRAIVDQQKELDAQRSPVINPPVSIGGRTGDSR